MTDQITVTRDERGVARLCLSREAKRNAMSAEMMDAIALEARILGQDPKVRVVVLEAQGGTFCAGGDLGWMQTQMAAGPVERRVEALRIAHMLRDLNALPKPLIAQVQGNAFGGGVGLLSVADVVFAAEGARFGLTETRLGLIPATIGPYVLSRIGEGAARRYFASSEVFGAETALTIGIVSEIVAPDALAARVEAQIAAYLACAPGAIAAAKALALSHAPQAEAIENSVDRLISQWEGEEAVEGIAAFLEKRPPAWARD